MDSIAHLVHLYYNAVASEYVWIKKKELQVAVMSI